LTPIARKFGAHDRPWLVLGIGASHPDKDWSDKVWTEFLGALQYSGTIFLIGGTPVLTYSKFIHAIVPDGGPSPGGMRRISPAQVLEHIAPYLSHRKIRPQDGV
jgi:hypothetical protein